MCRLRLGSHCSRDLKRVLKLRAWLPKQEPGPYGSGQGLGRLCSFPHCHGNWPRVALRGKPSSRYPVPSHRCYVCREGIHPPRPVSVRTTSTSHQLVAGDKPFQLRLVGGASKTLLSGGSLPTTSSPNKAVHGTPEAFHWLFRSLETTNMPSSEPGEFTPIQPP